MFVQIIIVFIHSDVHSPTDISSVYDEKFYICHFSFYQFFILLVAYHSSPVKSDHTKNTSYFLLLYMFFLINYQPKLHCSPAFFKCLWVILSLPYNTSSLCNGYITASQTEYLQFY